MDPIMSNVLVPLFTRVGTLATGFLVGMGANTNHAEWVGLGVAGLGLIGVDLGLAWLRKRSIQRKAVR